MATVYRAEDLERHTEVAIKVFDPRFSDLVGHDRFRREIEAASRLRHAHIVPLLDSGVAGGLLYYVIPMCDGSLAERLAGAGRLGVDEALRIVGEVATGLEHAHQQGLVHRDVKPQNLLFLRGRAAVSDFGLARAIERAGEERLTPSDAIAGTPLYTSPEQVLRKPDLDGRADQYSLACVLYEMLAGGPPFSGSQPETLWYQHSTVEPPPLARWRPDAPPGVGAALERALAKHPTDRFPDMAAFARALLGDAPVAARAPSAAVEHGLPMPATSFVGRGQELWACAELLEKTRLLTLTGPGGIGKTRLALKVADRRRHAHPDGVWFVDLATVQDPDRIVAAVAATLRVREEPGSDLLGVLRGRLGASLALLVLDNAEHLVAACARLADELLRAGPHLRLLVTSREPLRSPAEHLFQVPPLGLPDGVGAGLAAVEGSEAVRLFVDRAVAVRPDFRLTDANAPLLAQICRRLDGLPLAIELAATRLRLLSLDEVLAHLDERFRLLADARQGEGARHASLQAAIDWSVEQLDPATRRLFRRLSVFRGGWTLEAARAVGLDQGDAIDALDALSRLADESLLVVEPADGETRYRYLETIREYALAELERSEEAAAIARRHLDYFVARAEQADRAILEGDDAAWLARLDHDHENSLAALGWAAHAPDTATEGLRLSSALYRFWFTRGHYETAGRALESALRHPGALRSDETRAAALFAAAGIAQSQGRYGAARRMYEQCLELYDTLGNTRGYARTQVGFGLLDTLEGRFDAAHARYGEALDLYRRMDLPLAVAITLLNLGGLAIYRRDFATAETTLLESLALARVQRNARMTSRALVALGLVWIRLQRLAQARVALSEGLAAALELKSVPAAADGLEACVEMALAVGEDARAAELLGAAEGVRRTHGLPREPAYQEILSESHDRIRTRLGDPAFAAAVGDGAAMPLEPACRSAIAWLEPLAPRIDVLSKPPTDVLSQRGRP